MAVNYKVIIRRRTGRSMAAGENMTATVYTFHAETSGEILATAAVENVQHVARIVAFSLTGEKTPTRRAFVHNGKGIVAAGLCRNGVWHDMLKTDFQRMEPTARAARTTAGIENH